MGNQASSDSVFGSIVPPNSVRLSLEGLKERYLLRQISIHSSEHERILIDKFQSIRAYSCPHLIQVVQFRRMEVKTLCGTTHKLYALMEKPTHSLQQWIASQSQPLSASVTESLVQSLISATDYLRSQSVTLQQIAVEDIFVDQNVIKMMHPILCQTPPLQDNLLKSVKRLFSKIGMSLPMDVLFEETKVSPRDIKLLRSMERRISITSDNPSLLIDCSQEQQIDWRDLCAGEDTSHMFPQKYKRNWFKRRSQEAVVTMIESVINKRELQTREPSLSGSFQ